MTLCLACKYYFSLGLPETNALTYSAGDLLA
jgi:hypothetical protein